MRCRSRWSRPRHERSGGRPEPPAPAARRCGTRTHRVGTLYGVVVAAIVWLVAGLLLAAAEMLTGDFTLLMVGAAALVTAGVAALVHLSILGDAVVFGVSALALLFLVRPMLLRHFAIPPPTATNVHALPGKSATVVETVDSGAGSGRVKIDGEVWSARAMDPAERYVDGETVYVVKIEGAHAIVWKGL